MESCDRPPTQRRPRRRIVQFSLRTFLIATCAIGVSVGLLGQLFQRNTETFLVVVAALSGVGPFLLATGTIFWIAMRRKSAWPRPFCGKCGSDLRWADPGDMWRCPECEADLTEPGGLALARARSRRKGLAIWAMAILLMPLVGAGIVMIGMRLSPFWTTRSKFKPRPRSLRAGRC